MAITFVRGDIFLSRAPAIGIDVNARGQHEDHPLALEFAGRYPAAFAAFRKQARAGNITAGEWWIWREANPWLALLVTRESGVGATRLRHVEAIAQRIAQDWQQEGLRGLALARPGDPADWPAFRDVLLYWLGSNALRIVVYEEQVPGVRAPEPWDAGG